MLSAKSTDICTFKLEVELICSVVPIFLICVLLFKVFLELLKSDLF